MDVLYKGQIMVLFIHANIALSFGHMIIYQVEYYQVQKISFNDYWITK